MVLFEYAGISNGTLDGTLSWYSVNSYGRASPSPAAVFDPYTQPYPTPSVFPNGSKYLRDPAGWGYLLYPPPPSQRTKASWAPVESVSCDADLLACSDLFPTAHWLHGACRFGGS